MVCPSCQADNKDTAKFCDDCGANLLTRSFKTNEPVPPTPVEDIVPPPPVAPIEVVPTKQSLRDSKGKYAGNKRRNHIFG